MTNNEAFVRLDNAIKNDTVLSQLRLTPMLDRSHCCGDICVPINIASNVYITKKEALSYDEKSLTRILRYRTLIALYNIKKLVDDNIDRLEDY